MLPDKRGPSRHRPIAPSNPIPSEPHQPKVCLGNFVFVEAKLPIFPGAQKLDQGRVPKYVGAVQLNPKRCCRRLTGMCIGFRIVGMRQGISDSFLSPASSLKDVC